MLREPNPSQPVPFLSREPELVLAVIREDDGARCDPGAITTTRILEVRVSSADFVRIRRAIGRLRRRRAAVGRPSPSAKPGPGRSPAAREFLEFEQGAGV
jgi:hypothetical protein